MKSIKRYINEYQARGFAITYIHGDNEFNNNCLKDALEHDSIHIYSKVEHVFFIENVVKTVK